MIAAKITFEIFLNGVNNLKEKRKIINSLKDTLRNNFNISISEVDYEDLWQRSKFLIGIVGKDLTSLDKKIQKIFNFLKEKNEFELIDFKKEYF
ncbi:MAG: DUF503 domain-containing protein [candidate division WOR-3 bacterium]|uniref:DUF503 domain-containing protein n=1 Tax=candidate division WOR-3 bacterium TaxID=2052148 RepID=A0A7V4E1Q3_UNCW3